MAYVPCDAITIFPRNVPSHVERRCRRYNFHLGRQISASITISSVWVSPCSSLDVYIYHRTFTTTGPSIGALPTKSNVDNVLSDISHASPGYTMIMYTY